MKFNRALSLNRDRLNRDRLNRFEQSRFVPLGIFATAVVGLLLICPAASGQQQQEKAAKPDRSEAVKQNAVEKEATEKESPKKDEPKKDSKPKKFEYTKRVGIIYDKGPNYRLACDIYQPVGEGPFPAVLAIHGGAWRHGSKIQMLRHAWELASRGYVVVSINYRLAPDNKFPTQVHDCKTAVRWMRFKADKLKIDADRIAAFGYSAGAHLAAMLGTTDSKDEFEGESKNEQLKPFSTRVQCVIAGGAPCEFDWIKSRALVYWLGHSPQANPEVYKKAAPMSYISKDDPPFLFIHGTEDKVVPPESSKKMHEQLTKSGIESRYVSVEGKGHIATFSDLSWMESAIKFMDDVMAEKNDKR